MNLTVAQALALATSTLSILAGASAQFTVIFGAANANTITTMCSLLAALLGGWIAVLSGQGAIVKQVAAMPGVDSIVVNTKASPALATLAIDPDQPKVGAAVLAERTTLMDIAKGDGK
jgi:hypothetical protein